MGLRQNIQTEPVTELELRDLVAMPPTATVRECVAAMKVGKLGCVIVVDPQGKPLGKFTERKLLNLLITDPRAMDRKVSDAMYPWADDVTSSDTIEVVIQKLNEKGLRFLCVVDGAGKAMALTGQKGLIEYIVDHFPRAIKTQRFRSKIYMDTKEGA